MEWYDPSDDDIFFPTLQIRGGKTVVRTRRYGPIDRDYFWLLYPNMLEYQQALKVTIYCPFNFKNFPFDSQHCEFKFGSVDISYENLQLNATQIIFETNHVDYGEGFLLVNGTSLPFDFALESLESVPFQIRGLRYSYARMRFHLPYAR